MAQAQDPAAERRQAFVLVDVNGDGCLQLAELAREMAWRFAALDADRDGLPPRDELVMADDARVRPHRPRRRRPAHLPRGDGPLKEAHFAKADA